MEPKAKDVKLEPAQFGGFGKDFSSGNLQGGLVGKQFDSRCPPDVLPNTTVVGVCGVIDTEGEASPKRDGWMYSDFFLFHHLLKGACGDQTWLAPVSPEHLVKEYGEYIHGDPKKEDRRVVLDHDMLDEVQDIEVVRCEASHESALRDRFLRAVKNACEKSTRSQANVLVLVFCHGFPDNECYEFILGGTRPQGIITDNNKQVLVQRSDFYRCIGHKAKVTLLTTSCYGGGWAQTPQLNTTTLAGAPCWSESLSWPGSASCNRNCGGRFASSMTQALVSMTFEDFDASTEQFEKLEYGEDTGKTYTMLCKSVYDSMQRISPITAEGITFSARDDAWNMEWKARTGYPLVYYRQRWESLKKGPPPSGYLAPGEGISMTASIRLGPEGRTFTRPCAIEIIKAKALRYYASYPGPDELSPNTSLHSNLYDILRGKDIKAPLDSILAQLEHRRYRMAEATGYKNMLGIDFPDCEDCDAFLKSYQGYRELVVHHKIFEPGGYSKGSAYLALAIKSAGWTTEQSDKKLAELKQALLRRDQTKIRAMELHRDRNVREMLDTLARSARKTLRGLSPVKPRKSMSPVKHQRKSLTEAFPELKLGESSKQ